MQAFVMPPGAAAKDLVSDEMKRQVLAAEPLIQAAARVDPVTFNSYVLKDEETGMPIQMQPMHKEWHKLITGHKRTMIWSHVEAGKTQQISIGRVLYELGRNANLRVVIVSNTDGQAQKICRTIGKYIESSAELHAVFPQLKPDKVAGWTQHQLNVKGRLGAPKDASVTTCGIHGNILGARIDLLIVDDILDYENSLSASQREELWRWFHATLEGRLTRNAKVICVGTAWHREDIMHRWAKQKAWMAVRYPIINSRGRLTWPERWPRERIIEKQAILGPVEYSRQLMCTARNDEDAHFKIEWIDACRERGAGKRPKAMLEYVPAGYRVFTGVDLATGKKKHQGDLTCLFTIAVHPDESREVLNVQSGRWTGPEIVERIYKTHQLYQGIMIVENNAAQEFILQFSRKRSATPVVPFTTGKNKLNPEHGVTSLAVEMANEKWIIPYDPRTRRSHPEIEAWIQEMLSYDPKGHTGDRLMASWFAREGARAKKTKGGTFSFDTVSR
jgi:hypothetical protein